MTGQLQYILAEFRRGLEHLYGPRLVEVVLFGSQARSDASPDSDIDVMIVVRGAVDSNEEIRRVSPLASELSLKHDVVISCVHISEEGFRNDESPLLLNVRREGVLASLTSQQEGLLRKATTNQQLHTLTTPCSTWPKLCCLRRAWPTQSTRR